jgi:serine-type anaerobic sulfatase-maturating enzyme
MLEIIVKTTDRCNASCSYCSASAALVNKKPDITIGLVERLFEQAQHLIRTNIVDHVRFLWHGGEPLLLGKDFFHKISQLNFQGGFSHGIQTNMTLIDDEWIEILEPLIGKDGVGTSFDPFSDERKLFEGDYKKRWLAALAISQQNSWKIGCVYVVHRQSLDFTESIYWFFRNLCRNSNLALRVNPLLNVGKALSERAKNIALRQGDYSKFLKRLAIVWLQDQKRLVLSPIDQFYHAMADGVRMNTCEFAGAAGCVDVRLGVDSLANVYNCGRAVDAQAASYGNLDSLELGEILKSPLRKQFRKRERSLVSGQCKACQYWCYCHGGCPYESHASIKKDGSPTLYCEDLKRFFYWFGFQVKKDQLNAPKVHNQNLLRSDFLNRKHTIEITSEKDLHAAFNLFNARKMFSIALPLSLLKTYYRLVDENYFRSLNVDSILFDLSISEYERLNDQSKINIKSPVVFLPIENCTELIKPILELSNSNRVIVSNIADWPLSVLEELTTRFLKNTHRYLEPWMSISAALYDNFSPFSLERFKHYSNEPAVQNPDVGAIDFLSTIKDWTDEKTVLSSCGLCEVFQFCHGALLMQDKGDYCLWLKDTRRGLININRIAQSAENGLNYFSEDEIATLINKKEIFYRHNGISDCLLIYHLSLGIGDRILLHFILKYWRSKLGDGARIILVTQSYKNKIFNPGFYKFKFSEIWQLEFAPVDSKPLVISIHMILKKKYPKAKTLRTIWYTNLNPTNVDHSGIETYFTFKHVSDIVEQTNTYPEFEIFESSRENISHQLYSENLVSASEQPESLIAVHCRQAEHLSYKNIDEICFLRLIKLFKQRLDAKLIGIGGEDTPPIIKSAVDLFIPPDPSLQLTAAALEKCHLFVGGDSGPMHLSAAVGTPTLLIQNLAMGDFYGPFCENSKFRKLEGYEVMRSKNTVSLCFDEFEAFDLSYQLLQINLGENCKKI